MATVMNLPVVRGCRAIGPWCIQVFNNPIIHRELVVQLRKKASFYFLFLILLVASSVFIFEWSRFIHTDFWGGHSTLEVRVLLLFLTTAVGLLLLLFVPLLSATAINLETERDTWDLLRTSPIRLTAIVVGKLLSSLFFIWILLLSLIPIFSMIMPLGGVSPLEIILIFGALTEGVILVSLIGLFCSIRWPRTVQSISFTYLFTFLYFIGFPLLSTILMGDYELWLLTSPLILSISFRMPSGNSFLRNMPLTDAFFCHGVIFLLIVALLLFMSLWQMMPQHRERFERWAAGWVMFIGSCLGKAWVLSALIWSLTLIAVSLIFYLNRSVQFTHGMFDALSLYFGIAILMIFPFSSLVYYHSMGERKTWEVEDLSTSNLRRIFLRRIGRPLQVYAQWMVGISPLFFVLFWGKPYTLQPGLWLILFGVDMVLYVAVISLVVSLISRNIFEGLVHSYVILVFALIFLPFALSLAVEIFQCLSPFYIALFPLWKLDWESPFSALGTGSVHLTWMVFHGISSGIFLFLFFSFFRWRVKRIVANGPSVNLWKRIKGSLWTSTSKTLEPSDMAERAALSDRGNPVAARELRDFFLYHRSSMIKNLLGVLIASLCLFWLFPSLSPELSREVWGDSLEYPLLFCLAILPFFVVPYAANTFRRERDKETWDLIATTTLSSSALLNGKLWGGLGLFSVRYGIFLMPLVFLGYLFWLWGGSDYKNFWLLFGNFVGIACSFSILMLFFSVWMSIQARKTITAFILALLFPYVWVSIPFLVEFSVFGWIFQTTRGYLHGIFSPLHLLVHFRQYHNQEWWFHLRNIQMSSFLVLSGVFYYLSLYALHRNRNRR